nr:unnamed protein product [Callosobruchus analis]
MAGSEKSCLLADNNKCKRCGKDARTGYQCINCKTMTHLSCIKYMKNVEKLEGKTIICCDGEDSTDLTITASDEQVDEDTDESFCSVKDIIEAHIKLLMKLLEPRATSINQNQNEDRADPRNAEVRKGKENPILTSGSKSSTGTHIAGGTTKFQQVATSAASTLSSVHTKRSEAPTASTPALPAATSVPRSTESKNDETWQTVRGRRNRRRDSLVIGSNTSVRGVEKKAVLHVSRIGPDVTAQEMTSFLKNNFPEVQVDKLNSKRPDVYSSFKIEINHSNLKSAIDAEKWPRNKTIIITGDFNVKFNTEDGNTMTLINLMESFGLHYTVYANTRGNACIDNIFTNLPNGKYCTTTVDLGISDHLGIVFCYSSSNNITLYNHRINIRPITEEGLYMLYNILQNVDWLFINDSSIELELKCEKFVFLISAAIENSFPLKSKHANTFTKDKLQWFTPELNNIRDTLNLLREINKTYPELITKSSISKYHQYYKNQLNIAKRRYHDNYILQSNNKQKARWEIINKSKQSRQCQSCTLKPSELNNYFINIPEPQQQSGL